MSSAFTRRALISGLFGTAAAAVALREPKPFLDLAGFGWSSRPTLGIACYADGELVELETFSLKVLDAAIREAQAARIQPVRADDGKDYYVILGDPVPGWRPKTLHLNRMRPLLEVERIFNETGEWPDPLRG